MIWVAKNLYFFNCLLDGAHTIKLPGLFLPFLQKKNLKWSLSLTFFYVSQAARQLLPGLITKWRNRIHSKNVE